MFMVHLKIKTQCSDWSVQDKDMVQLLLEMKSNLDAIVQQAFQKNESFANALKEAFENFINQRQNKYASP